MHRPYIGFSRIDFKINSKTLIYSGEVTVMLEVTVY